MVWMLRKRTIALVQYLGTPLPIRIMWESRCQNLRKVLLDYKTEMICVNAGKKELEKRENAQINRETAWRVVNGSNGSLFIVDLHITYIYRE
jgi:hypothetical protein